MAEKAPPSEAKQRAEPYSNIFVHHAEEIWESREPYGPSGFGGLFSNYYATLCAAFAALGGLVFGFDQVRFRCFNKGSGHMQR